MRASVASLSKKFVNAVFAATLALGLVPAAAFAQPASEENADAASAAVVEEDQTSGTSEVEDVEAIASEAGPDENVDEPESAEGEMDAATEDDAAADIPALDVINQEVALDTVVAQAESTRTFFLAQTLESTRTVPIVSAKLPLDTSACDRADQSSAPTDQPASSPEEEGEDPDDESDPEGDIQDDSVGAELDRPAAETQDGSASAPGISAASTVVGSFTYLGMTFAMEPGGETVALVAVDYNQLPEEFVQRQVIVIPEAAETSDGDMFSVTRIADGAFAGLTADNANQDYVGCELLFSDEELLAEAGLTLDDVSEYLAPAAESDASSDGWVPDESGTYEEQDSSDSSEDSDDIRTIVSMEGNVATLDDGSTYEFTNPLAGKPGILAVGIPASVTSIGDEAFAGAGTLQYLVVDEDNPEYASYDGALYSADLTQLRLIPEGRVGALCVASSASEVLPEVFSHCPSVDTLLADAESGMISYELERLLSSCLSSDSLNLWLTSGQTTGDRSSSGATVSYKYAYVGNKGIKRIVSGYGSSAPTADTFSRYGTTVEQDRQNIVGNGANYIFSVDEKIYTSCKFYVSSSGHTLYFSWPVDTDTKVRYWAFNYRGLTGLEAAQGNWLYSTSLNGTYKAVPSTATTLPGHIYVVNTADPGYSDGWDVKWDGNGAVLSKTEDRVAAGETVSTPDRPELDGWNFGGWYIDSDFSGDPALSADATSTGAIDATVTYYAKWTRDVTFNFNDKQPETPSETRTGVKNYGMTTVSVTTPTPPTRPYGNADFQGWGPSSTATSGLTGREAAEICGELDAPYEMYARWKMVINLNPREGTVSQTSYTVWDSGTSPFGNAVLALPSPRRVGYTFNGWKTSSDGTGTRIDSGGGSTAGSLEANAVGGSCELFAGWDENNFRIRFADCEGKSTEDLVKYTGVIDLSFPNDRGGYVFDGWLGPDGNTYSSNQLMSAFVGSDTPNGQIFTFTAQWRQTDIKTITLAADTIGASQQMHLYYWPGIGYTSSNTDSSARLTLGSNAMPSGWIAPAAAGFEFLGYYDNDADATNVYLDVPDALRISKDGLLQASGEISHSVTWTPHWRPKAYALQFKNIVEGQVDADHQVRFAPVGHVIEGIAEGPTITLPAVVPPRGKQFDRFVVQNGSLAFAEGEDLAAKRPGESITIAAFDASWPENDAAALPQIAATYKNIEYSVSYDVTRKTATGQTLTDVASAVAGSSFTVDSPTITLADAPETVKPGYRFVGWQCSEMTGDTVHHAGDKVSVPANWELSETHGDVTFMAVYELVDYAIVIDTDWDSVLTSGLASDAPAAWTASAGQSGVYEYKFTAETPAVMSALANDGMIDLPASTKMGYHFVAYVPDDGSEGYFTGSGAAWRFNAAKALSANAPVRFSCTARYEASGSVDNLNVRVALDGVATSSTAITEYTSLDAITAGYTVEGGLLPDLSEVTLPGYEFAGWTCDVEGALAVASGSSSGSAGPLGAVVRPGFIPGQTGSPTQVTANFSYRAYPLYLVMGESAAELGPNAQFAKLSDEERAEAFGAESDVVTGGISVYRYLPNGGYRITDGQGAGIAVPEPRNQGRTFAGWVDDQAASYGSEFDGATFKPGRSITDGSAQKRVLTATWSAAEYSITFANTAHVSKIFATTDSGEDIEMVGNKLTLDNDLLARGVQVVGIAVDENYYTTEAFKGFRLSNGSGNLRVTSDDGWESAEGGKAFTSAPGTGFKLFYGGGRNNVPHYFPDDGSRDITVEIQFYNDGDLDGEGNPVSAVKHYTASIDLGGGEIVADTASDWTGSDGEVGFTHLTSGSVVLPQVQRKGYKFTGWSGAYAGYTDEELKKLPALSPFGLAVGSTDTLPADAVGNRVYTATWAPRTANVFFRDLATPESEKTGDYLEMPSNPNSEGVNVGFPVEFGKQMNYKSPNLLGKSVYRKGYLFLGFFDTAASSGGKCYYGPNMESMRAWDKDNGTDEQSFTLYARWSKVTDGMNPAGGSVSGDVTAVGRFSAVSKLTGQAEVAFNATYSGMFAWETYQQTSGYPAATETVTVIALNSYEFASSFDVKTVPSKFDYTDENDGTRYRLLGFSITSGKHTTYIPFTALLSGESLKLTVMGNDLVAPRDQPSFEIATARVTALYTTGDPGYTLDGEVIGGDDPTNPDEPGVDLTPADGEAVVTLFDAGEGLFEATDTNFAMVETAWHEGQKPTPIPAAPVREGYDFVGWSLEEPEAHDKDDAACCSKTDLAPITSRVPVTYHAHYTAKYANVFLSEWPGKTIRLGVKYYGDSLVGNLFTDSTPANLAPEVEGHPDLMFKGYFDDEGKQYINAAGDTVREWDKDVPNGTAVYLSAKWVEDPLTESGEPEPITPSGSDPSADPDEDDPFPGVSADHKAVPTNPTSRIIMPVGTAAEDGAGPEDALLYDGVYDGTMRFTDHDNANRPTADGAGDDNVEVTIFSYQPTFGDASLTAHKAHERVRKLFEDWASEPGNQPAGGRYLQGFKVVSTGWNISLADLHVGRTITVQCLASDLVWDETADGATAPADVRFAPGKVVAVWSATPVIDPGYEQWPVKVDDVSGLPATQVLNHFDAGVGRFLADDGKTLSTVRRQSVSSLYGGTLNLPKVDPEYRERGYRFDGWWVSDEAGNSVRVTEDTPVDWYAERVIYAHYVQTLFTITLHGGQFASDFEDASFEAWKGQSTDSLAAKFEAAGRPERAGYTFAGWYAYEGEPEQNAGTARPYYVTYSGAHNNDANLRVSTINASVDLYPYWEPRTYTITWDYVGADAEGYYDPPVVTWQPGKQTVTYGELVPDFPVPDTPHYTFYGWFDTQREAAEAKADNGLRDIVAEKGESTAGKYFQWSDEKGGYVFAPPREKDADSFTFYAGWSHGVPVKYKLTLHAGTGPDPTFGDAGSSDTVLVVDNAFRTDRATGKTAKISLSLYEPHANQAGWVFAGWKVKGEGDDDSAWPLFEGTTVETGSGDVELVAQWSVDTTRQFAVRFLKGDEVSQRGNDYLSWYFADDPSGALIGGTQTKVGFDATSGDVAAPTFSANDTTGYVFDGWQRVSESTGADGQPLYADMASSKEGFVRIAADDEPLDDQRLVNIATSEGVSEFIFRAVWKPKTFEVQYWMDGQAMANDSLDAASTQAAYDARTLVLPHPVFAEVGSIFRHWGNADAEDDLGTSFVPGELVSVKELLEELGTSGVTKAGSDRSTLKLYGAQIAGFSFTVPTQVLIKFDPDRPADSMIAGEARLAVNELSGSSEKVAVESVQLDLVGDFAEAFAQGNDLATYGGSSVDLLVRARHESDDEADSGEFLRMNLGASGAIYHSDRLAEGGFDIFAKGDALKITYKLDRTLDSADRSFSAFRNLLSTGFQDSGEAMEVAKLFYTVGLAPKALSTE